MIVTRGEVLSSCLVRSGPCTRFLAKSSALRYPVERVSIALLPTIIRACSMIMNICLMPSCTPPTRVPTAGRSGSPPNVSSQVVETFRPILCSRLVTLTPFRSPSEPSSFTRYFGTRNMDRPLVPAPAPSGRASTRWKMFSAMSCSAPVMNRLTPSMCQVPSGCSIALARPAPTSEPASGSVSTIVAPHSALDGQLGEALLLGGAELPQHGGERRAVGVHPGGRVRAEDEARPPPTQRPGHHGAAELWRHATAATTPRPSGRGMTS